MVLACPPHADAMRTVLDGLCTDGILIVQSILHEDFKVSACMLYSFSLDSERDADRDGYLSSSVDCETFVDSWLVVCWECS